MDENKLDYQKQPINTNQKKITVVSGDGKDLDISNVYNHLNVEEPNTNNIQDQKIVIPPDSSNK